MTSWRSLLIGLAAILWSTDALFRLPLTQGLSAYTIVFYEHLLAMVFVIPIIINLWPQVRKISSRQWWAIAFIGIAASALATLAFTLSFSYVSPSVSILLQKLQPLVTFGLAFIVLGERLPRWFWLWAGLALVGAYFVSFPEVSPNLTLYNKGIIGVLLAILAAALWGGATVFGRFLLSDLPFPLVAALRFVVALPFLAILAFTTGGSSSFTLTVHDLFFLTIIMVGPGFGAMYLYYRGLQVTRATVSALLELMWPLSAVVLNWIFLHETLTALQIAGGLVLIGSIARLTIWQNRGSSNVKAQMSNQVPATQ